MGVFGLINSTAAFLGFTESWDLTDDGLFTCGDRQAFRCGSAENFIHLLSVKMFFPRVSPELLCFISLYAVTC